MGNQIVSNTPSPHPDQNIKPTCAYQRSAQTYLEKRAKGDDYTYGHLGLQLFLKYVWMCRSALHPNKFGENMKTHQVKEVTITYIYFIFIFSSNIFGCAAHFQSDAPKQIWRNVENAPGEEVTFT